MTGHVIVNCSRTPEQTPIVMDDRLFRNIGQTGIKSHRKLLDENIVVPVPPLRPFQPPISPSPSPSELLPTGAPEISPSSSPSPSPQPSALPNLTTAPSPSTIFEPPPSVLNPASGSSQSTNKHIPLIISATIGGFALIGIIALLLLRGGKVATVRPWATGLSVQLQKAFITGGSKVKKIGA